MTARVRIAVVEDQRLFRALLVKLLEENRAYQLVGEAGDTEAGWQLCTTQRPDLALLDLQMPGGGGLGLAARLHQELPGLRLLALTSLKDSVTLQRITGGNFHGYVEKDQPVEVLEEAIATVAAGRPWFSPFFEQARRAAAADPDDWRKILSDREQEVLSWVGRCHTSQQIAAALGLSQRTIETHRYNIMKKLRIEDSAALIRYAQEKGFATPGSS